MFKEDVGVVSGVTVAEDLFLDEDLSLLRKNFDRYFDFRLLGCGAVTMVASKFRGTRSGAAVVSIE